MSSVSTDADSDLIQMNVALGDAKQQRLKENVRHLYQEGAAHAHHAHLYPGAKPGYPPSHIYGSQYSTQYSSDSGYSTTTDEEQRRKKRSTHAQITNMATFDAQNGGKDLDIYATLPRKGTQKAALRTQSKDAEVYQGYLQRQDTQLKPRHRSDSESSIANLSTAGNHSRQSSGASLRMSKEEINQHLSDFVRTKQSSKESKKQAAADKQLQKMLKEDMLNMQRRQLNFKDGKQPLPVQPPTVPDSKLHLYKPCTNPNQNAPTSTSQSGDRYGAPVYVDHKQLNDMSHQTLLSYAQNLPPHNHSRESSASSSHTLKAHSRDNSFNSPAHAPSVSSTQAVYGAYKPVACVTDRRVHNTSAEDMRPFPGAEPPNDPGGSRGPDAQQPSGPGSVAQRIAALGHQTGTKFYCEKMRVRTSFHFQFYSQMPDDI